jgi:hypothetical protein
MTPESACVLTVDETGLTECFGGIQLHVAWDHIHGYTLRDERLLIHFLNYRSFIVPFRYLSPIQRDDVVKALEARSVRNKG